MGEGSTTSPAKFVVSDDYIPSKMLLIIGHVESLFSEHMTAELEHAKLHFSAHCFARALHCIALKREYEWKLARLGECKNQIHDMLMLLKSEKPSAASSVTPPLPVQKPLFQIGQNVSASANQIVLCMKLARNGVWKSAVSQLLVAESDHVDYHRKLREESILLHHVGKKFDYERKVSICEESDVSVSYQLMSLGYEMAGTNWKQLLGSGAALIEAVEKVINSNDCYRDTYEAIRDTQNLKSAVEMLLITEDVEDTSTCSNEAPILQIIDMEENMPAAINQVVSEGNSQVLSRQLAVELDKGKLESTNAGGQCLKRRPVYDSCSEMRGEKYLRIHNEKHVIQKEENMLSIDSRNQLRVEPVIQKAESMPAIDSRNHQLYVLLEKIEAMQSDFRQNVADMFQLALQYKRENDKFCSMKCLEAKINYEQKVKELEEYHWLVQKKISLLECENVVSDGGCRVMESGKPTVGLKIGLV